VTPSGGWIPAVIAGRTGIGLSQRAQSFVFDPAENPFNVMEPGKRPRVTLTPTLALQDGLPWMAFSVQGGDSQDQNLLQAFLNLVEFGMTPQQAVEAPNMNSFQMRNSFQDHTSRPGRMLVAASTPAAVREQLQTMGYTGAPGTASRAESGAAARFKVAVARFQHETCTFCPGGDMGIDDWTRIRPPFGGEALLDDDDSYVQGFVKMAREFGDIELVGLTSPYEAFGGSSRAWTTKEAFDHFVDLMLADLRARCPSMACTSRCTARWRCATCRARRRRSRAASARSSGRTCPSSRPSTSTATRTRRSWRWPTGRS
jgi:hypothetical protein